MQNRKPIYTAVQKYTEEMGLRLHMPGHGGGFGFDDAAWRQIAMFDVTEVPGTGDLHVMEGDMEAARMLLAQAYGAQESLFLVNGASSGIHTLFLSLNPGSKVLVPRNAHRSFFSGLVLSGLDPVYIPGKINYYYGFTMSIQSSDIMALLRRHSDVQAVFITSPNYFGINCDVEGICQGVSSLNENTLVFVDEAHGGHFPFHPEYPAPALRSGADAAVNGLHKTLPVLNQGACMHLQDKKFFYDRVLPAWSMITTSSPSYPILVSIDAARCLMMTEGEEILDKARQLSQCYKSKIGEIEGLSVFTEEDLSSIPGPLELDPLKILIGTRDLALRGEELMSVLRREYAIQVELAGSNYILAMMSMFHQPGEWERFYLALKAIAARYRGGSRAKPCIRIPPQPNLILTPRKAYFSSGIEVDFSDCRGKIAGEMIAPYPPGIPCLLPGELISEEVYEYLQYLKDEKVSLQGPGDRYLNRIKIIDV